MDKPTYYEEVETVRRVYQQPGPVPACRSGAMELHTKHDRATHVYYSHRVEEIAAPPPAIHEVGGGNRSK